MCRSSVDDGATIQRNQSLVAEVDCETVAGEKICPQYWLSDVGYPEFLFEERGFAEFQRNRSFPISCNSRPISCYEIGAARFFFYPNLWLEKTDSSAPVSTKKERPEIISVTEIELELTAQIAEALIKPVAPFILHWLCRFPGWLDVETLHKVGRRRNVRRI